MSDDVLEYVEPVVSYSTPSNGTESLILTREIFTGDEEEISDEIGTTEGVSEPKSLLLWVKGLEYDSFNITAMMSLTFRQVKEIPDDGREFNYLASLGYLYTAKKDGGWFSDAVAISGAELPEFETEKIGREEFVRRINVLVNSGISNSFEISD